MKRILVTGSAGFIGFHLSLLLLKKGFYVIGIDNMNSYYDPKLKEERETLLKEYPNYKSYHFGLEDFSSLEKVFSEEKVDICVNLAAQAGVRYSITNPDAYIESNIIGFYHILECCRHFPVEQLIYASSSSVYGANEKVPYCVEDKCDAPVSLYAATKKSNELFAYAYSKLYQIPARGVRFFTVYGEWGRPDMAYYSFSKKILTGEPITLFNNGKMERDFTYVGDVVEGLFRMIETPVIPKEDGSLHAVYNLGNSNPVALFTFVHTLEEVLETEAKITFAPMQKGDVVRTYADLKDTIRDFHFEPSTPLKEGLEKFVKWYRIWRKKHEI